jgi:chromosome partitioning protein
MAAKICVIYNQKGGCGKTMTAMQLAASVALRGYATLVVDMDRQGTGTIWSSQASPEDPFPATVISLAIQQQQMIGEIKKLASTQDVIFIDCPPAIESSVPWAALNIADLGLIPVTPVLDNIWASKEACTLGLRAKQENPSLHLAYVVSMFRRGKLFDLCLEELKKDQEIKIMNSIVSLRNAFPESQVFGTSVHGLGKKIPAVVEIEALTSEVLNLLNLGDHHG